MSIDIFDQGVYSHFFFDIFFKSFLFSVLSKLSPKMSSLFFLFFFNFLPMFFSSSTSRSMRNEGNLEIGDAG